MNQGVNINKTQGVILALVTALLLTFAFSAIAAQTASAQGPGSALCDRYPELPQCQEDEVDDGNNPNPEPDADDAGPTGDSSGNLPFTGYPLTALILLLLLLLIVGLTVRAYLVIRDRISNGPAAP